MGCIAAILFGKVHTLTILLTAATTIPRAHSLKLGFSTYPAVTTTTTPETPEEHRIDIPSIELLTQHTSALLNVHIITLTTILCVITLIGAGVIFRIWKRLRQPKHSKFGLELGDNSKAVRIPLFDLPHPHNHYKFFMGHGLQHAEVLGYFSPNFTVTGLV